MDFLARYICVCCIIASSMASSRIIEFFPDIHGNLSLVTWAHAVNNISFLESTLNNDKIMMIEADVSIGNKGNEENTTIMAHPPNNKSDLSLSDFLDRVSSFNKEVFDKSKNGMKKGIKLDFKTTPSLERGIEEMKKYAKEGAFPIWVNADIFPGPIDSTVTPVNATKFFEITKNLSNIVLSVGWTTNYGPDMIGRYNKTQIDLMISKIKDEKLTKEITFPVRAGLAAESADKLEYLLSNVTNSTLTLWSSENDNVNVTNLNKLLSAIGFKKVYIDVPESLHRKLNFDGHSGDESKTTPTTITTTSSTTTPITITTTTHSATTPTTITTTNSTTTPTTITTTSSTITPTTTTTTTNSTTTPTNTMTPPTTHLPSTTPPKNGSENMLIFSILTLLFCVIICLL